jgi:hypothetical protein
MVAGPGCLCASEPFLLSAVLAAERQPGPYAAIETFEWSIPGQPGGGYCFFQPLGGGRRITWVPQLM